jgi:hypothetical protein
MSGNQIIVLTQANVVQDGTNSSFTYNFPSVWKPGKNTELALSSINVYYAIDNITTQYNNNSFTYTWTVGATTTTYIVTLPDGMYNISDINSYLQYVMQSNGHYLINSAGQNVYYIEILTNLTLYGVNVITYPVPFTLPTGYTQSSNFAGFPTTVRNCVVTFTGNNFGTILGYSNTFVSSANIGGNNIITYNSTTFPTITQNPSFFVSCNCIRNSLQIPSSILASIVPTVGFTELITQVASSPLYLPVNEGMYNNITVTILGAQRQQITLLDPNITIVLIVKSKD